MNQFEVTKAVLALTDFRAPDGVDYVVALQPRPGDCRVVVAFSAGGRSERVELVEPPDEPTLRDLYRIASGLLDGPRDSWARVLGLSDIGGDE